MAEEFGPYRVFEQLGVGGMASVHRAELRGAPVALKRLLPEVAGDPRYVKALIQEGVLARQLRHPNIAQTYDVGRIGEQYFIAMEYVRGPTLAQVIIQMWRGEHLGLGAMLRMLVELASAIHHAHTIRDANGDSLDLVHRDVSPTNVIISHHGITKLIDFGVAHTSMSRGSERVIEGKFGYLAPEYLEGRLDGRADLFAWGVVAWELLARRRLFHGQTESETIQRVRSQPVAPPSAYDSRVPAGLDAIVLTALERDPAHRWQSAAALRAALLGLARGLGASASRLELTEWMDRAFSQAPWQPPVEVSVDDHSLRVMTA